MLPILFLHTLFLLCPSTLSQSLLPPHFFLRFSSLSSSLPSFASTLFSLCCGLLLFEEQSADGERRCFVRRVSAPGCATAVDSRESRGMSWRLWEKDERETHTLTHTHTCEFHSSPQLLADGWRSCCLNSSRTLRERERESDGERKGTGERADMKDRVYECCPLYMPYKKEEGKREKWKERYLILYEQSRQGLFPLQWRKAVPNLTRAFISLTAAGCYIHLQWLLTVSTTNTLFLPLSLFLLHLSSTQQVWTWLYCR